MLLFLEIPVFVALCAYIYTAYKLFAIDRHINTICHNIDVPKFCYQLSNYQGEQHNISIDVINEIDLKITDYNKNVLEFNGLSYNIIILISIEERKINEYTKIIHKSYEIEALSENIALKLGREFVKIIKPIYEILINHNDKNKK